jgi:apolipoprotein N-acyltransferase
VIAPDGSVVQRTRLATQAELDVKVPLRDGLTLADRVGAGPEWALSLIGLGAVGFAVWGRRRKPSGTPA